MNVRSLFCIFLIALGASSCSVTERQYRHGYYIQSAFSNKLSSKQSLAGKIEQSVVPSYIEKSNTQEFPITASTLAPQISLKQPLKSNQLLSQLNNCDTIFLKDGSMLLGTVTEINPTEIKYKKCDNPNGPTMVLRKTDVSKIIYINGTSDVFNSTNNVIAIGKEHNENTTVKDDNDYYSPSSVHKSKKTPYSSSNNQVKENSKHSQIYKIKTNPFALWSMILALVFVNLFPLIFVQSALWLLLFLPAPTILGVLGFKDINANPEVYKGKWMAMVGIICNGVTLLIALLLLIIILSIP